MEIQVECLRLEGRRAVVQPEGPVARVSAKAVPALRPLAALNGCQAHCSVILSPPDESTYKKLGLQLTCEPQYQTNNLYHR